ncbi:MAG: hypothetical protein L0312_34095 [Acidobacteria bacterium]|nr:hypothetical protein [Acidobacteriota bacterium]
MNDTALSPDQPMTQTYWKIVLENEDGNLSVFVNDELEFEFPTVEDALKYASKRARELLEGSSFPRAMDYRPTKSGVTVQETTAGAAARCLAESELVLLRKVAERRVTERQVE